MLNKYTFILLFLLTSCLLAKSQDTDEDNNGLIYKKECILKQTMDSVKVGFYLFSDKETSYVLDSNEEPLDEFKLINEAILISKEINKLNKYISSQSSFGNQQALLGHVDVEFDYYIKGFIVQRILYSSMTRNFIMFNKNDNIIIRNSANKKLHIFVAKILKHHKIWNKELEFNFYENN